MNSHMLLDNTDREWDRLEKQLDAAREALVARQVTNNQQLAELAEVVRSENCWEGGEDGEGTNKTCPATSEIRALFGAIEKLAQAS